MFCVQNPEQCAPFSAIQDTFRTRGLDLFLPSQLISLLSSVSMCHCRMKKL